MEEQYHLNCDCNEGRCDGSTCDTCEHGPLQPCPNPSCDHDYPPEFTVDQSKVVCPDCAMTGPEGANKAEAREFWNSLLRNE